MKIYRLDTNRILDSSAFSMTSSTRNERQTTRIEHYASLEKAEKRRDEIMSGLQKLVGYVSSFEVVITTIEVIE